MSKVIHDLIECLKGDVRKCKGRGVLLILGTGETKPTESDCVEVCTEHITYFRDDIITREIDEFDCQIFPLTGHKYNIIERDVCIISNMKRCGAKIDYENPFTRITIKGDCNTEQGIKRIRILTSLEASPREHNPVVISGLALSLASMPMIGNLYYYDTNLGVKRCNVPCMCAILLPLQIINYYRIEEKYLNIFLCNSLLNLHSVCSMALGGNLIPLYELSPCPTDVMFIEPVTIKQLAYAAARSLGLASIIDAAAIASLALRSPEYIKILNPEYMKAVETNVIFNTYVPYSFATGLHVSINSILEGGAARQYECYELVFKSFNVESKVSLSDQLSGDWIEVSHKEVIDGFSVAKSCKDEIRYSDNVSDYSIRYVDEYIERVFTGFAINTLLYDTRISGKEMYGTISASIAVSFDGNRDECKPMECSLVEKCFSYDEYYNIAMLKSNSILLVDGRELSIQDAGQALVSIIEFFKKYSINVTYPVEYIITLIKLGLIPPDKLNEIAEYRVVFDEMTEPVVLSYGSVKCNSISGCLDSSSDGLASLTVAAVARGVRVVSPREAYHRALRVLGVSSSLADMLYRINGATIIELLELYSEMISMPICRSILSLYRTDNGNVLSDVVISALMYAARSIAMRSGASIEGSLAAALLPEHASPTERGLNFVRMYNSGCIALSRHRLARTISLFYLGSGYYLYVHSLGSGKASSNMKITGGGPAAALLVTSTYGAAACQLSESDYILDTCYDFEYVTKCAIAKYLKPAVRCIAA